MAIGRRLVGDSPGMNSGDFSDNILKPPVLSTHPDLCFLGVFELVVASLTCAEIF